MRDTTPGQKCLEQDSFAQIIERCKTFDTLMKGPDPLSQEELKKLIEQRPELWGSFRSWLKQH